VSSNSLAECVCEHLVYFGDTFGDSFCDNFVNLVPGNSKTWSTGVRTRPKGRPTPLKSQ